MDRKMCKEIESHFYGYACERARLEERQAEIAEDICARPEEGSVKGGGASDPTLKKVMRIEKELGDLSAWIRVVECTAEYFRGGPQAEFIAMVYTEGLSVTSVCTRFYIDRSTYFRWREKILSYAAIKAAGMGLMSFEQ